MSTVYGVVCSDCGNLIPQSQIENPLNPHICGGGGRGAQGVRRRPTTLWGGKTVNAPGCAQQQVRYQTSAPPPDGASFNWWKSGATTPWRSCVDWWRRSRRPGTPRGSILHRRLHELLQEAIETAEVYRPSSLSSSVTEPLIKEEPSAEDEDKWE